MENITGKAVVDKDYLKTRLFLVDELKDKIRKYSVIIEAPRRFGKTSVIKELMRQEENKSNEQQEFNTIFLELEGEESLNQFCFKLFKELLSLYKVRRHLDLIGRLLGETWNVIAERIPTLALPEIEIELRKKTRDFDLSAWKEKIEPLVKGLNSFDKKTIIVFDEFPDMLMNFKVKGKEPLDYKEAVDSLNSWLRSLRQEQASECKYQFIFCGSINLRKTLEEIGVSKRINDLEPFVVPPLRNEEAKILIEELLNKYSIEIDKQGMEFLVSKVADGSPYYGQILIKALIDTREKVFNFSKLKSTYNSMLRMGNHDLNHFHSRLEDYLSPLELECCSIILKQLCADSTPEKQIYETHLFDQCSYKDFQKAVNRLIYEGYLRRDINDSASLCFVSPLLKEWWACKEGVF